MILLTAKPLFTTFEVMMLVFIGIGVFFWIATNIKNGIINRRAEKHYREMDKTMRVVEPLKSTISSKDNITLKN